MLTFNAKEMEELNNKISEVLKNKVVGAEVALFNDNKLLYLFNYGYADKKNLVKSDENTLYKIGSNTKVMTSMAIFKLYEKGLLDLDDDIKKYLPEFEVKANFTYSKITIANLLSSRSGLVSDLFNVKMTPDMNLNVYLDAVKDTYLTTYPGKMDAYSNVGYALLGLIIERISGKSYEEFINEEIASPLDIKVYFLNTTEKIIKESEVKIISKDYDCNLEETKDFISQLNYIPAGSSIYMSLASFSKFCQAFLNSDNKILKESTLLLMERCIVKDKLDREVINHGYGLIHNNYILRDQTIKVLGHGGDTITHHSMFNYLPNHNLGVVTFTNTANSTNLSRQIGFMALEAYLELNNLNLIDYSLEEDHLGGDLDSYIGNYATNLGLVSIYKHHHTLYTKFNNYKLKLLPCEDGYLHAMPNSLFLMLPSVKQKIMALRFKVCDYQNEDILVLEVTNKKYKTRAIIGSRIDIVKYDNSVDELIGHYQILDQDLKEVLKDVSLEKQDNVLILNYNLFDNKRQLLVEKISPHHLITLGYGRRSKERIRIIKDDGICLVFSGLTLKKVN